MRYRMRSGGEMFARIAVLLLAVSLASCSSIPALPKSTPPTAAGYRKYLENRLGPMWTRLMNDHVREVQVGTVQVTFEIPAAGGHPQNYRVVSNTAAKGNEAVARAAIDRLKAPPVPEAVLKETKNSQFFRMEESFTTYQDP